MGWDILWVLVSPPLKRLFKDLSRHRETSDWSLFHHLIYVWFFVLVSLVQLPNNLLPDVLLTVGHLASLHLQLLLWHMGEPLLQDGEDLFRQWSKGPRVPRVRGHTLHHLLLVLFYPSQNSPH